MLYESTGHFPTYNENRKLRQWALVWYKKEGENEPEKMKMLESIGFTKPDKWAHWNAMYSIARQIYNETGAAPTTKNGRDCYRYFSLWLMNSGHLHGDRVRMLQNIGFAVRTHDVWESNFEECETFFKVHGHFPTQREKNRLNLWAKEWAKRCGADDSERLQKLRDIGFSI